MNINKLYINRSADHHVTDALSFTTDDGALAVKSVLAANPEAAGPCFILYKRNDYVEPTAGTTTYWKKNVADDGTVTYDEFGTFHSDTGDPVEEGDELNPRNPLYSDLIVYKVFEEGKNYVGLILQEINEWVFFETASLTKEEKEELVALTDMCAHEILEEYLDNNAEGEVVNGDGDPSDMNISGDPGSVSHAKVSFLNPATPDRITWFDWSLSMLKPDGTSSPAPLYLISDKAKESCTLTAPTGLPSGQINVKVVYTYKTPDSNIKRRCKGTFIVGGWNDPVIMVDDEDTYDKCDEYGMIMSPASKDAANFAGCRDLTMGEMINEPAMTVCRAKGWLNAGKAKKAEFLMGQGMSEAEANALADKFMLLSEAKQSVVGTGAFSNNTALTHFESFAYFTNFGSSESAGIECFKGCTNLTSIMVYHDLNRLPKDCFNNCLALETFGTLKD